MAVRDAKRHMWMEVGRVAADVQKLKVQELAVSLYVSLEYGGSCTTGILHLVSCT